MYRSSQKKKKNSVLIKLEIQWESNGIRKNISKKQEHKTQEKVKIFIECMIYIQVGGAERGALKKMIRTQQCQVAKTLKSLIIEKAGSTFDPPLYFFHSQCSAKKTHTLTYEG